jgi:prepilin-type N-terminal cleavage/methylation domain-containing protein
METPARAGRGFTLVELMIAMSLGTLLLAGAFVMHAAFSRQSVRQQEIGDMQQSLRVAADVMTQAIRGAGGGMGGGTLNIAPASTCTPQNYYPIEFSNSNVFNDPRTKQNDYDGNGNDNDADPDWLRVIAADTNPRSDGTAAVTAGEGITGGLQVPDTTMFTNDPAYNPNQLFFVYNNSTTSPPSLCARQVTSVAAPQASTVGTVNKGGLASSSNCWNPVTDNCLNSVTSSNTQPTYVFRGLAAVVFRVDQTDPKTPRLMASYTVPGQPPNWQILAENIEDLQIALILTDGTICGRSGNSVDGPNPFSNPRSCGAAQALATPPDASTVRVAAVRFTLTARSSNVVSGFNATDVAHGIQSTTGGFEDEPATVVSDGYLRRSLTSVVEVRSTITQ